MKVPPRRAKGHRPQVFDDPAIDQLHAAFVAMATEAGRGVRPDRYPGAAAGAARRRARGDIDGFRPDEHAAPIARPPCGPGGTRAASVPRLPRRRAGPRRAPCRITGRRSGPPARQARRVRTASEGELRPEVPHHGARHAGRREDLAAGAAITGARSPTMPAFKQHAMLPRPTTTSRRGRTSSRPSARASLRHADARCLPGLQGSASSRRSARGTGGPLRTRTKCARS